MSIIDAFLAVTGLVTLAVLLIWPVQRVMVRRHVFRREPLLALLVWQAVSLAAVGSLLTAGPLALWFLRNHLTRPSWLALAAAGMALTAYMVIRLLRAGHQVGAALRRTRRQHIELLELVGREFEQLDLPEPPRHLRVIDHPTPTAYCVPGVRRRVVISTGMLARLDRREVLAVLAHERAHVRGRHDLLVEFFTVLHTAMPARLRQEDVLAEVRLLAEVLADRAGSRDVGVLPMGRALVALAGSQHPSATLAAGTASIRAAQVRLNLLTETGERNWIMVATMIGYALIALTLPVAVVVWIAALT